MEAGGREGTSLPPRLAALHDFPVPHHHCTAGRTALNCTSLHCTGASNALHCTVLLPYTELHCCTVLHCSGALLYICTAATATIPLDRLCCPTEQRCFCTVLVTTPPRTAAHSCTVLHCSVFDWTLVKANPTDHLKSPKFGLHASPLSCWRGKGPVINLNFKSWG